MNLLSESQTQLWYLVSGVLEWWTVAWSSTIRFFPPSFLKPYYVIPCIWSMAALNAVLNFLIRQMIFCVCHGTYLFRLSDFLGMQVDIISMNLLCQLVAEKNTFSSHNDPFQLVALSSDMPFHIADRVHHKRIYFQNSAEKMYVHYTKVQIHLLLPDNMKPYQITSHHSKFSDATKE